MVKHMAKDYNLFVPEAKEGAANAGETVINRRQFLRYGFNTATGVLAASLGVLGLLPFSSHQAVAPLVTSPLNSGQRVVKIQHGMGQSTFSP